jgi:RecA-family ATPase
MADLGAFAADFVSLRKVMAAGATGQPAVRWKLFASAAAGAARCVSRGLNKVDAADALLDIAHANGLTDENAIQDILAEAFEDAIDMVPLPLDEPPQANSKANGRAPKDHAPLAFLRASQWNGVAVPPKRWLIENRIPMRQVALLSGTGAIGKTTIALQLAVAVAAGLNDWLGGIINEPGPVIFFTAEEEEADVQHRLNDIVKHHGIELPEDLHVHCVDDEGSVAGDACVLGIADRRGVMQPTDTYWRLRKAIDGIRPKLIIIESASDVFGGDEINRQQVRAFVRMLKAIAMRYDCVVLLLSHPSAAGMRDGSGISGSTQWRNGPRCHMFFKTAKGDEEDEEADLTDHRELEIKKLNQGRQGERVKLLWKDGVFIHETTVGSLQRIADDAAIDDLFLKLLHRYHVSGRNVCEKASPTFAPAQFAKEAEAKAAHITKRDFDQSMRRLMSGNEPRVKVLVDGPQSKRRGRLVDTTTEKEEIPIKAREKNDHQQALL